MESRLQAPKSTDVYNICEPLKRRQYTQRYLLGCFVPSRLPSCYCHNPPHAWTQRSTQQLFMLATQ
jgi:hypothetical protein